MRYRNSECNFTPDNVSNADITLDANMGCYENNCRKNHADWNRQDGWHMPERDNYMNKNDGCHNHEKDNCMDKNDGCHNHEKDNCMDKNDGCSEDIKRRLSELQFAAIDLNLFLDTHPCDEEALKMYKKITKTIESVKYDYIKKYGPLKACDSTDDAPFQWASEEYKWPWEK